MPSRNITLASIFIIFLINMFCFQNCGTPFDTLSNHSTVDPEAGAVLGTKLAWDSYPGGTAAEGFRIYLNDGTEPIKSIPDIQATEILLSQLPVTLDPNVANRFYITAYSSEEESSASNEACWGYPCQ